MTGVYHAKNAGVRWQEDQKNRLALGTYLVPGICPNEYLVCAYFKFFRTSRVGSGRVKIFSNLTGSGGVGSFFFKTHGSGQVGSRGDEKLTGQVRSWPASNGSLAGAKIKARTLVSLDRLTY